MVTIVQNHVSVLQSFLSNSALATPEQAAEAAFHISRAAAQSATPKPAVTLAQTVLTNLSKTPCISAIPHLLSICENDPFEALDVFVLSSAAWKALVAAAITAPPEPHLAMRIISCAALNAITMITKCIQPSANASPEVVRTVKIAKFYCLNAARCSRAFSSSIQHLPSNLLSAPVAHLLDLLALSSFVLLFDHHSMLPAHHELQAEVLPLATRTVKTLLAMMDGSPQEDCEQALGRALESTAKHQAFAQLLLPTAILRLMAVVHVSRCALDTKQLDKSQEPKQANYVTAISLLMPFLFHSFDMAYEELILFREQGGGQAFLDIVTSTTSDIISTAHFGMISAIRKQEGLDFLLEQVTSDNPIRSHIAQDALLHMAIIANEEGGWRDRIATTVFACLRTSLALISDQVNRWQKLAVNLCEIYVQERKSLNDALAASQRLCSPSVSGKGEPQNSFVDDPIPIVLLAQLCDLMIEHDTENTIQDATFQSQMGSPIPSRTLEVFQLHGAKLAERAQALALATTGHVAVNAISLLPHVLGSKSVCAAALSILQRESSTPSMICAALNILNPSAMQPVTVDAVCTAGVSVVSRYGTIVCPAMSAFVSKAACCLGKTVSLAHWQQLSALLESCLITSQEAAELDPPISHALAGIVLHYAAVALSAISTPNREERQTQATLPKDIVNDVHDALMRLEKWRSGEDGYNLEEQRALVREERKWSERPLDVNPSNGMNFLRTIRDARERIIAATSLRLDGSNLVWLDEELRAELKLLEDSVSCIMRCRLPSGH